MWIIILPCGHVDHKLFSGKKTFQMVVNYLDYFFITNCKCDGLSIQIKYVSATVGNVFWEEVKQEYFF